MLLIEKLEINNYSLFVTIITPYRYVIHDSGNSFTGLKSYMKTDSDTGGDDIAGGISEEALDYWSEQFEKPDTYKPSLPDEAKTPCTSYTTDSGLSMLAHEKTDLLMAYATFRGKRYF